MFKRISALFGGPKPGKPNPFAPVVPASTQVAPPIEHRGGRFAWSLADIRAARDMQLRGEFFKPVRLAEAMRTDDALFTAYTTRVSTQSAIKLEWYPKDSRAGRRFATRAETSILAPECVRESILGTLANHGIAVGYVQQSTEDDPEYGPTTTFLLTEWPLEFVRYNATQLTLETRTLENGIVTISHGDGRWIVFRKFGHRPWAQDACVLPGALIWAAHAEGISDWAGASYSHGQPKLLGTLREGVSLGDGTNLTPEAQHLLNVLASLAGGDSPAGVIPAGADAKLLFNGSNAWQVFQELITNREKAAMRVYLGTDAVLGAQGGAPGVDIAALFNVANTRIQGDFEALERGFREGMILPWAQLHGFAKADAPGYCYAVPDTDADKHAEQEATAIDRLKTAVLALREAGLKVTQDTIDALAQALNVSVSCTLAPTETPDEPIALTLAPADVAKVLLVREARAAAGYEPFGDERDDLTVAELGAATAPVAPTPQGDAPPADTAPTDAAPESPTAPTPAPTDPQK